MRGEMNLSKLIKEMTPVLNEGSYVFVTVTDPNVIDRNETICEFKEQEGTTIVIEQQKADILGLEYHYVCAWITLKVHSSLEAVGLTAAFSEALAKHHISCNIIAGYYHDHIFVAKDDAQKAIQVLTWLSESFK